MSSYTPLQQDRQARNRPTHVLNPGESSSTSSLRSGFRSKAHSDTSIGAQDSMMAYHLQNDETFEERERRDKAARFLESNEMLIWWALQRNESLPQTRLHFEKVLAGLDSDNSVEWEGQFGPDSDDERKDGGKNGKSGSKGSGRATGSGTPEKRGSGRKTRTPEKRR